MDYFLDTGRLTFFIIVSIIFGGYMLVKRKNASLSASLFFLIVGIGLLVVSVIIACVIGTNSSSQYIFAFLSFKNVSEVAGINASYYLRTMSYVCLFGALVQFVIAAFKKTDE